MCVTFGARIKNRKQTERRQGLAGNDGTLSITKVSMRLVYVLLYTRARKSSLASSLFFSTVRTNTLTTYRVGQKRGRREARRNVRWDLSGGERATTGAGFACISARTRLYTYIILYTVQGLQHNFRLLPPGSENETEETRACPKRSYNTYLAKNGRVRYGFLRVRRYRRTIY